MGDAEPGGFLFECVGSVAVTGGEDEAVVSQG